MMLVLNLQQLFKPPIDFFSFLAQKHISPDPVASRICKTIVIYLLHPILKFKVSTFDRFDVIAILLYDGIKTFFLNIRLNSSEATRKSQ